MPGKKTVKLFTGKGEEKNALHKHTFHQPSLRRLHGLAPDWVAQDSSTPFLALLC